MLIEYSSNNSGGNWWLSDDDWYNLEKAGWTIKWEGGRFLGALAMHAEKEFPTIKDALLEFEDITGQDVSAEGCSCCGPPHEFEWTDENGTWDYISGSECLAYMYDNVPSSLREAVEKLNKDA